MWLINQVLLHTIIKLSIILFDFANLSFNWQLIFWHKLSVSMDANSRQQKSKSQFTVSNCIASFVNIVTKFAAGDFTFFSFDSRYQPIASSCSSNFHNISFSSDILNSPVKHCDAIILPYLKKKNWMIQMFKLIIIDYNKLINNNGFSPVTPITWTRHLTSNSNSQTSLTHLINIHQCQRMKKLICFFFPLCPEFITLLTLFSSDAKSSERSGIIYQFTCFECAVRINAWAKLAVSF